MPFVETPRFPDAIARGTQFGPAYSTALARNIGGHEVRNKNWSMPLYRGDVSHGAKTQALIDDLLAFFHHTAGMYNGFRFKDFADFEAAGAEGTLTAIVADTSWQLYKTYTYGAITATRKIQKPVTGVAFAGGGTYELDTATGIVTRTAGANPTSWTGEFDTPVRFNLDEFLPIGMTAAVYNLPAIPIIEIRI